MTEHRTTTGPAIVGRMAEAGAMRLARGLRGTGRVVIRWSAILVGWVARRRCRQTWSQWSQETKTTGRGARAGDGR